MFDKLMTMGKKIASLGSGNPAQIATAFAPPDSPYGKAASLGMKFASAGGGLGGLKSISGSIPPLGRAFAMKDKLESLKGMADKASGMFGSRPEVPNQLSLMASRRQQVAMPYLKE